MKIEKNVPMPPAPREQPWRKGGLSFAKVEGLEVGDSILHRYDDLDHTLHARLKASSIRYGKRVGQEFETRNMPDGIRIWRVK